MAGPLEFASLPDGTDVTPCRQVFLGHDPAAGPVDAYRRLSGHPPTVGITTGRPS